MAEYTIMSEQQIETYKTPTQKVQMTVITYQSPGLAPRTVWIESSTLPDVVYKLGNPGKSIPADLQSKGDMIRKANFDADIAKVAKAAPPRKI